MPALALTMTLVAAAADRPRAPDHPEPPDGGVGGGGLVLWAIADPGRLPENLIAGAAAGGLMLLAAIAYPAGMGMGDVKLAAVMGLYLARRSRRRSSSALPRARCRDRRRGGARRRSAQAGVPFARSWRSAVSSGCSWAGLDRLVPWTSGLVGLTVDACLRR